MSTFKCNNCSAHAMPEEDVTVCVFHQTLEEPAEYDTRCPECNSDDVEEESALYCRGCGDVQVGDEDEYCTECHTCMLEDRADGLRDERMMEGY